MGSIADLTKPDGRFNDQTLVDLHKNPMCYTKKIQPVMLQNQNCCSVILIFEIKEKKIVFKTDTDVKSIFNDIQLFIKTKSKLIVERNGFIINIKNAKLYLDCVNEKIILSF